MVGSSVPGRAEFVAGRRVVRHNAKAVRALHMPPGGYKDESGVESPGNELVNASSEDDRMAKEMLRARNRAGREGLRLAQNQGNLASKRGGANRKMRTQRHISQPAGGQRFGNES